MPIEIHTYKYFTISYFIVTVLSKVSIDAHSSNTTDYKTFDFILKSHEGFTSKEIPYLTIKYLEFPCCIP